MLSISRRRNRFALTAEELNSRLFRRLKGGCDRDCEGATVPRKKTAISFGGTRKPTIKTPIETQNAPIVTTPAIFTILRLRPDESYRI
jgi:hypothetical protein